MDTAIIGRSKFITRGLQNAWSQDLPKTIIYPNFEPKYGRLMGPEIQHQQSKHPKVSGYCHNESIGKSTRKTRGRLTATFLIEVVQTKLKNCLF